MSSREVKKLKMYDQNINDFDLFNSVDSELIEISSPPIKIYELDLMASLDGKLSGIDELYGEVDIYNEDEMKRLYKEGFGGEFDTSLIREGEQYKEYIELPGQYIEPTWVHELSRLGIESVEDELTITFNYDDMMTTVGREIKIGDVVKTFRGKIYKVDDAFIADETVGWKYLHYRVIARKPQGLDHLILPN